MGKFEKIISRIGLVAFVLTILAYSFRLTNIAYALMFLFLFCLVVLFIKELPNIIKYLRK